MLTVVLRRTRRVRRPGPHDRRDPRAARRRGRRRSGRRPRRSTPSPPTSPTTSPASRRPTDRAANATAKTLLLEEISGVDVSAGVDLDADLRGLMETDGDDQGRFSDTDSLGFGNFANGIGQALGDPGPRPHRRWRAGRRRRLPARPAVLRRQLPALPLRLRAVLRPAADDRGHAHLRRPRRGRPDATAFALQALLVVPSSPTVLDARSATRSPSCSTSSRRPAASSAPAR